MVRNHLMRLAAPRTWRIQRKNTPYIAKPKPGAHSFAYGMPLIVVLRDVLQIADTSKEVKFILNNRDLMLNGKIVKDPRRIVGLMDVISLPRVKMNFRVLLNNKNKLTFVEIDENDATKRIAKINNKSSMKGGKAAVHLHDGTNIFTKEDYKTGDSVVIDNSTGKISKRLEFKKDAAVLLTGGKHIGSVGKVVEIIKRKQYADQIIVKTKSEQFTTLKKFAYVIGEKEPLITV
ncbi:30S ribosomal protein S4e [Candidatus Woesearchaeota archaeon]|nr:30S ribosomal protein S4e [Candidatus Woesearchaeota archaeon]MBW3013747.1 30S ribosomal protein S4e [Candidatus Woesearchaeota archaeon]